MLQHQPSQADENVRLSSPLPSERRIEDYLDRVCLPMVTTLRYETRRQVRAQLRAEIDALVAAHEELGSSRDEAVELALAQVERSRAEVEPCIETNRHQTRRKRSFRHSNRLAQRYFGGAWLFAMTTIFATGQMINYSVNDWLIRAMFVWLPVAAGTAVGAFAPARPVSSAWNAIKALALPTLLAYVVWAHFQRFTNPGDAGVSFAAMHLIGWTLSGCGAAAVSGWLRRLLHPDLPAQTA